MSHCVLEIEKDAVFHISEYGCTYIVGWVNDECNIKSAGRESWMLLKNGNHVADLIVTGFVLAGLPEYKDNKSRITLSVEGFVDKELFDFNAVMRLHKEV